MSSSILKVLGVLFFLFISMDSFFEVKRFKRDIEKELLNPYMGKVLSRRAVRNGIIYLLVAILIFITIFFRLEPLDG
ncbi:MAG: hypothetical protein V1816_24835 [Pseudomonadota bacterium]